MYNLGMQRNQKGFMVIEILMAIIVIAFGGYWVWHNHQNKKTASSNISANDSALASSQALSNATSKTPYLTVKEWGVKIPITTNTPGLSYTIHTIDPKYKAVARIRTSAFNSFDPQKECSLDIVRGLTGDYVINNNRSKTTDDTFGAWYSKKDNLPTYYYGMKPKLIGQYYYMSSQIVGGPCGNVSAQADEDKENATMANLISTLNKMIAE
jgi:hypothetical protein